MNDRHSKTLLALVAVALWGILIRSFFDAPALQAKSPVPQVLTASVVTAREFQLVDEDGKKCGSLTCERGGSTMLILGEQSGIKNNIKLYTEGYGGFLDMSAGTGQNTVRLSAIQSDYIPGDGGGGNLQLRSDKDNTRLSAGRIALTHGVPHVSAKSGSVDVPIDVNAKSFIALSNLQTPPKSAGQ
ncbi:MAG: hypothetical protein ABIY70_03270 [Capsulimonas sp.]|uniref:hypothetical protein n=1 Tax=Capsulimonas sp. TaxID=2494211 RepID=UPI00326609EA